MGLATGIALAVILFLGFRAFASLFTTDSEVLEIAWSGILVRNIFSAQWIFFSENHSSSLWWGVIIGMKRAV